MKEIKVFVIAGQSNAVGNGYIEDLIDDEKKKYSVLYYATGDNEIKNQLTDVRCFDNDGLGWCKKHFGLEIGMSKFIKEKMQNTESLIIKCAFNGSSVIKDQFEHRGDWNVYDNLGNGKNAFVLIETINNVYSIIKKYDYDPYLMGIAWMQGEADYFYVDDYFKRIEALFKYIKKELNLEKMIFVMGEIANQNFPKSNNNSFYKGIYKMKNKYSSECDVVECSFLPTRCKKEDTNNKKYDEWDYVHYSGNELLILGEMFAQKIIDLNVKK